MRTQTAEGTVRIEFDDPPQDGVVSIDASLTAGGYYDPGSRHGPPASCRPPEGAIEAREYEIVVEWHDGEETSEDETFLTSGQSEALEEAWWDEFDNM
ncbi:MAG: hypothetical protein ABEN55_21165 [Bradymonadaceae bacterium]